ncbi:MAG: hypothetical protein D4R92_05395 [Actinobacteria bacterium]|nr:MAG: hypothetical protein D4R92_05395 [Actinomycetota bacterium]
MKPPIATSLSFAGVLLAGGLAFSINSNVLDSSSSLAKAAQSIDATPITGVNAKLPASTQTAVGQDSSFEIAGVGVATIRIMPTGLNVVKVVPQSGFAYEVSQVKANRIVINFSSPAKSMAFKAQLVNGQIVTAVDITTPPVLSVPNRLNNDGDKNGDNEKSETHHSGIENDDD